jgi:hypothetical protein
MCIITVSAIFLY